MTSEEGRVIPINIEDEMKTSYIDYAMSVIIGRAIPDVRDGLKPVHRRTLYAMWEMGNTSDKPYKKSARIVGDVMGKYHPHGDAAIYDTLVKMAQPFNYRAPLVEGQGNFGSIDGDAPAAMRYTEARLEKIAEELLDDISKDTVDFIPNFDESLKEPVVLPARVPNLLVNGTTGIAVGMATSMPPHNLGEVCSAVCAVIDDPEIGVADLVNIMPAPDFPTGGMIMGTEGVRKAYLTGKGKCVIRGIAEVEDDDKRQRIIISEIPFQVNKARLVENIAELVRNKKIEGISDLRDESDKDGIRVVIELKKAANGFVILNQLYKHTSLENTFGITNYAIVDNQPKILGLKDLISEFLDHRSIVIRRRCEFDLRKANDRIHILYGLLIALDNIDAVIKTIRASETADDAKAALVAGFGLDEVQADAILKMQLRKLAALEHRKILDERDELRKEIERLEEILSSEDNIRRVIRGELVEISGKYANERRSRISHAVGVFDKEDLIEDKPVLVTLTASNYIKRVDLDTYKNQRRGGRGIRGMMTKEDDLVSDVFVANTHEYLLCFTNTGRSYWLKVYDVPESARVSKGRHIANLLNLKDELVTAVIPVREFEKEQFFLFATKNGIIVKIPQVEFSRPRQGGIRGISLREGDELVSVIVTDNSDDLLLTTKGGQGVRIPVDSVPLRHRNALGVIGMRMRFGDRLQAITLVEKDKLLIVTEKGYGKRTDFDEFKGHGRGTKGVKTINTERSGGIIAAVAVSDEDEIFLTSASGIMIRTKVLDISIQRRITQGVRLMRLDSGDSVVSCAVLVNGSPVEEGEEEIEEEE